MKIINTTPFPFAPFLGRVNFPKYSLTLIVKGTFDLRPGEAASTAEEQLFPTGDEPYADDDEGNGSLRYESDFAYFKPKTDLLLVGRCHTPNGSPRSRCPVAFRVGDRSRRLLVYGDRFWKSGLVTASIGGAEPFEEMDLRYERSFGGQEYASNPVGKGAAEEGTETGKRRRPLPNIEDPEAPVDSLSARPQPAGFGPLSRTWGLRSAKLGTYRGDWVDRRWPWFPEDFDWAYFNGAPPQMQVEGYLRGDEEVSLENLHPEHPKYVSRLPGVNVRCFLNEADRNAGNGEGAGSGRRSAATIGVLREVAMNLDTVWVDTEAEKLVLVWRGVTDVSSEEYEEVKHVFVMSEATADVRKTDAESQDLFREALAAEEGELAEDEPIEAVSVSARSSDAELAKALQELNAELEEAGLPPLDGPPDPSQYPEPNEEAKAREALLLEEYGATPQAGRGEWPGRLTRGDVEERLGRGESLAGADMSEADLSRLDFSAADLQGAILGGAKLVEAKLVRANLTQANLAGADLTSASMDEAVLRDADLTGALLVGASLKGIIAGGALFEGAHLRSASLDLIEAPSAFFVNADLTGASARKGSFPAADFSQSTMCQADFSGANLREASVEGAVGIQVNMEEADLTELRASEGSNFSQGSFRKARGKESMWDTAALAEADFSYADVEGADFTSANLERANLQCANMKRARFTKARLRQAKMTEMNLFEGSLEKADMTGADLRGSNLYGAELLEAVVQDARFNGANLKMTKLARKR